MRIIKNNISLAIKRYDNVLETLDNRMRKAITNLAQIGIDVASDVFSKAVYDGTNDVVVEGINWVSDNKLEFIARGNAVAFIEFGTSITNTLDKSIDLVINEIEPNDKSIKEDSIKESVKITRSNPPSRAMYLASKEMRSKILDVIKEVFI